MTPLAQITMLKRLRNARAMRLQFEHVTFAQAAKTAEQTLVETRERARIAAHARYDALIDLGLTVGPPNHLSRYMAAIAADAKAVQHEADLFEQATRSRDSAQLALSQAGERRRIAQKKHAKTDEVRQLIRHDATHAEGRLSDRQDSGDV